MTERCLLPKSMPSSIAQSIRSMPTRRIRQVISTRSRDVSMASTYRKEVSELFQHFGYQRLDIVAKEPTARNGLACDCSKTLLPEPDVRGLQSSWELLTQWPFEVAAQPIATGQGISHLVSARHHGTICDASSARGVTSMPTLVFHRLATSATLAQVDEKSPSQGVDATGFICRDDRTAIELFLAGIRGWEAGLRRRMDDDKPSPK